MKLDSWQQELVDDESRYILLKKGRQVGGTYGFSKKSEKWMVEKGRRILVGSITEDQAKLVILMVYDILLKDGHKNLIKRGKDKPTQDRIRLKNGGEIRSRAVGTMGDAFRGFTGDVTWFNEMSKWPKLAFDAIMPTLLTTGGEMWGDSTPFGKEGFFWQAYQNKDGLWKIYDKSSEDVISNREISEDWTEEQRMRSLRFLEDQKKQMSELQYAQEYLGEFVDEFRRYFLDEWIDQVCTEKLRPKMFPERKYYLGVDIARLGQDYTSFQVVDRARQTDEIYHVHSEIQSKWLTTRTEARIVELNDLFDKIYKIYIDAGSGGLGVGVLDHLRAIPKIRYKVYKVDNKKIIVEKSFDGKTTNQKLQKEDIYDNMRSLGEMGKLHLLDDENIRLGLRSIQYEYVSAPNKKSRLNIFASPHNAGDVIEALVRACVCSKEKSIKIGVSSFAV